MRSSFTVLALALLYAGCGPKGTIPSSTRTVQFIGASESGALRYGLSSISSASPPPIEDEWSIVAWPEMTPLMSEVLIEPDPDRRHDYIIEVDLVEQPPGDWIGVIYTGGAREDRPPPTGAPLSEGRWLWRYYTSPEIEPESLDLAETPIELIMRRPVREPETSDVVELREVGRPPAPPSS